MSPASPSPTPSPDPGSGSRSTRSSRSAGSSRSTEPSSSASDSSDASETSGASPTETPTATPTPVAPAAAPTSGTAPSGQPAPDPVTTTSVQTALRAEHAAVWCYGLAGAFLTGDANQRAESDLTAHRARRDATVRLLADYGVTPVAAETAYRTPATVADQRSAMQLLVTAESDSAAAWRGVLERGDDQGLRRMALDGLNAAAVRGALWSQRLGTNPVVPVFPGRE